MKRLPTLQVSATDMHPQKEKSEESRTYPNDFQYLSRISDSLIKKSYRFTKAVSPQLQLGVLQGIAYGPIQRPKPMEHGTQSMDLIHLMQFFFRRRQQQTIAAMTASTPIIRISKFISRLNVKSDGFLSSTGTTYKNISYRKQIARRQNFSPGQVAWSIMQKISFNVV